MIEADFFLQINTFPLDYKVESAADLSDGFVLSKILGMCIFIMKPLLLNPVYRICIC